MERLYVILFFISIPVVFFLFLLLVREGRRYTKKRKELEELVNQPRMGVVRYFFGSSLKKHGIQINEASSSFDGNEQLDKGN